MKAIHGGFKDLCLINNVTSTLWIICCITTTTTFVHEEIATKLISTFSLFVLSLIRLDISVIEKE